MASLLERVASQELLIDAWNETRHRAGEHAGGFEEAQQFSRVAAKRLATVSSELLAGTWTPSPVRSARIPKSSGGWRQLGIPPLTDRIVERAILTVIDPVLDPLLLPWSFAYRRGLGVPDALRALAELRDDGSQWAVRGDFENCFDAIPRLAVIAKLREIIDDAALVELLALLIRRPVEGRKLSPLFANLYLDSFDRALLRHGHTVVRYADDFVIPVADRATAEHVVSAAQREAAALGLTLGEQKVSVHSFEEGIPFLGALTTAATSPPMHRFDHPQATTVFVTTPGAVLRSRGHRLRVEFPSDDPDAGDTSWSIAYERVRQIVVFGRAHLTTPLMQQLLSRGIDLSLLSDQGQYFGRLQGAVGANPFLRAAQYGIAQQPERQLDLARRIVAGKINNQRALLLRRQRHAGLRLDTPIERLSNARMRVRTARTLNELMGVEGAASREYYAAFGALLDDGFTFSTRRRRPPPDPVNSMLSFGYTLLIQEIISAIETTGLDSCEGVLHSRRVGRPSLALDLVEEFRTTIVDAVVLRAINTHIIRPEHFEYPDNAPGMCRLTADARKAFLREYERRQLTLVTHPSTGRRVSYRVAAGLQARDFAAELQGSTRRYEPMVWK